MVPAGTSSQYMFSREQIPEAAVIRTAGASSCSPLLSSSNCLCSSSSLSCTNKQEPRFNITLGRGLPLMLNRDAQGLCRGLIMRNKDNGTAYNLSRFRRNIKTVSVVAAPAG